METLPNELPMDTPKDCWCGWNLTPSEQKDLIHLTMDEFKLFPKKRRRPEQLVKQILGMHYGTVKSKRKRKDNKERG
jgi:hypothetical protein